MAEPGPYLPWDLWDEVLGCEARLRDAEARRARVAQFGADREDA